MSSFKFHLGDRVRDRVNLFQGTITVTQAHLTGCNRYYIEAVVDSEGKLREGCWSDENVLELTGERRLSLVTEVGQPPG